MLKQEQAEKTYKIDEESLLEENSHHDQGILFLYDAAKGKSGDFHI